MARDIEPDWDDETTETHPTVDLGEDFIPNKSVGAQFTLYEYGVHPRQCTVLGTNSLGDLFEVQVEGHTGGILTMKQQAPR